MRVGLVTDNLPSEGIGGGIGTYVVLVAEELARRGIEAHVFRWRHPENYAAYQTNGVTYHLCPRWVSAREDGLWQGAVCQWNSRTNPLRADAYILRHFIGKAAAKTPFDLLEFPDIDGYAVSGLNLRGVKKTAVRLHGCSRLCRQFAGEPDDALMTALDEWESRAAVRADVLTSVSHSALAATEKAWKADLWRAKVVPNPIAPIKDTTEIRDATTVFFSGRLERRKGIDVLAKAIPLILRAVPESRFCIFGKDKPWDETQGDAVDGSQVMREILRSNDVCGDEVKFMGAVPREVLLGHLRRAAIALVPSRYENQPFAVLEALACGTPLIVSDIPAHREIIRNDAEGVTFTGENANQLAQKTIQLLTDPARRAALSESERRRSEDFHVGPVTDKLLAAWGV